MLDDLHLHEGGKYLEVERLDPSLPEMTLGAPKVLCIPVDARILGTTKRTLSTVFPSADCVYAEGCRQDPTCVLQMLLILFYIISHPSLAGLPLVEGAKRPGEENLFMESHPADGPARKIPRVDMYRETLKDPEGGIVGYFFWLFLHDKHLCINRGFTELLEENRKRAPPKPND